MFDSEADGDFETELRLNKADFFGSGSDLIVHVESASDLPDVHWLVGLSPKVVAFFPQLEALNKSKHAVARGKAFETKKSSGKNPVWNERKTLRWSGETHICLKVFEERLLRKDACLGQQSIDLTDKVVKGVEPESHSGKLVTDDCSEYSVHSRPSFCRRVTRISSTVELAADEYDLYSGPRGSGRPRIKVTFEVPADTVCIWCQQAMCACAMPLPPLRLTQRKWIEREEYLKHPNVGQPVELSSLPVPEPETFPIFDRGKTHVTLERSESDLTRCVSFPSSQSRLLSLPLTQRRSRVGMMLKRKFDLVEDLAQQIAGGFLASDESTVSRAEAANVSGIICQAGSSLQIHLEGEEKPQDLLSMDWKTICTKKGWECVEGRWRSSADIFEGGIQSLKAELEFARVLAKTQDQRSACEHLRGAYGSCLADFEPLDYDEIYELGEAVSDLSEKDVARMYACIEKAMKAALPIVHEMKEQLVAWSETNETMETKEVEPSNQLDNDEELALNPHHRKLDPSWTYWSSDHDGKGSAAYKDLSTGHVWVEAFGGFRHESDHQPESAVYLEKLQKPLMPVTVKPSLGFSPRSGCGFATCGLEDLHAPSLPPILPFRGHSFGLGNADLWSPSGPLKIDDDVQKVKAACEASLAGWNSEMEALCGKTCRCLLQTQSKNLRMFADKPESGKYWWAFPMDVMEPPAFQPDGASTPSPRGGSTASSEPLTTSKPLNYWEPLGTHAGTSGPPVVRGDPEPLGKKGQRPPRLIDRGSAKTPLPLLVNPKLFIPKTAGSSQASSLGEAHSIAQVFRQFDTNGDGVIDREELERLCEVLGFSIADLDELLSVADLTGDSTVDYEEFVSWICDSGDQFAEPFAHLRVAAALAYVAHDGEELYVPMSRLQGRLLLRPDGSFSYVPKNMARFSDGVQGIYEREGTTVSLTPEFFGSSIDKFDTKSYKVILTEDTLDHRGPRYAGCHVMHLPEAAVFKASWLAPT